MQSFDKYSNFSKESSFSSVIFGAEKPVLEVELNEVQQILNVKIGRIMKALGTKVLFITKPTTNVSQKLLTIGSALVLEEESGYVVEINNATLTYKDSSGTLLPEIYIRLEEVDVDSTTELHSYGNTKGAVITNPIKDSRMPGETSRRKCLLYTLQAGATTPSNTSTVKYVHIATSNSGGTLTYDSNATTDSILKTLISVKEDVGKISSGALAVANANKLGGNPPNYYEKAENHKYKTMTQDELSKYVSKMATPKELIDEIPDKCVLYATSNVSPTWFPTDITALGCVLTVVRYSSTRVTLTLSNVTNNAQNYYAGYDGTNFTGWVSITSTNIVVPATVE